MKAVVSFQAGIALVEDSGGVQVLCADDAFPSPGVRAAQHLLLSATDLVEQDVKSVADLRTSLALGFACDRGLQMFLILIDGEEDRETRQLAGECCEDRLSNPEVQNFVVNRLHQQPLPQDADPDTAIQLAQAGKWRHTGALLTELLAAQPVLHELTESLAQISDELLENAGWLNRECVNRELADGGVVRTLCRTGRKSVSVAALRVLQEQRFRHAGFRLFLTRWIAPLKREIPETRPEVNSDTEHGAIMVSPADPPRTSYVEREQRLQRAEKQISKILDCYDSDDARRGRQWADQLFKQQNDEGDAQYAVRSMCRLASELKSRGLFEEQLHFSSIAAASPAKDANALCQRADALLCTGRKDEALAEYKRAIDEFPDNVVSRGGFAETLRDLNRYDEALSAYEATIARYPDDVVSRSGFAETLRDLNRYDEALSVYEATVGKFPCDVFARCGLAVVLSESGKTDEAQASIRETITKFPLNWVAKHIHGMLHVKAGDLFAARGIFERGISDCTNQKHRSYFQSGLALVWLRQGAPERALLQLKGRTDAIAEVLRMHACGESGNIGGCQQSYSNLQRYASSRITEPRNLLVAGYLTSTSGAPRTAEWRRRIEVLEERLILTLTS